MRAKLDENLPTEAVDLLRRFGWDCDTVHDEGLSGAEDVALAAACKTEGRVLFTLDLDFADLRAYPPDAYPGIVVLRPAAPGRDKVLALIARALPTLATSWLDHCLWIVEPTRLRVRGARRQA